MHVHNHWLGEGRWRGEAEDGTERDSPRATRHEGRRTGPTGLRRGHRDRARHPRRDEAADELGDRGDGTPAAGIEAREDVQDREAVPGAGCRRQNEKETPTVTRLRSKSMPLESLFCFVNW